MARMEMDGNGLQNGFLKTSQDHFFQIAKFGLELSVHMYKATQSTQHPLICAEERLQATTEVAVK